MKQHELGRILYLTSALIFIYLAALELLGFDVLSISGFSKAWSVVPMLTFFWSSYFSFGWKIKYLNKLLFRPNLNGTWTGKYASKGTSPEASYEGEICLVIRQSFLTAKITSYSSQYMSCSYAESLLYSAASNATILVYVYSQNQFDPSDSEARKGTAELRLLGENREYQLFGEFWTNKTTSGSLNVTRTSKKRVSSFQEGMKLIEETKIV